MTDLLCIAKRCEPRTATQGLFCTRCYWQTEKRLSETPSQIGAARRDFLAAGQGSGSDGSRRTKGHPPIPINVDVLDKIERLTVILGSWTQMVCEERDLRGPDHRNDATATSCWLLGQLGWIVEQPWSDDFADEVSDATRKLRTATHDTAEMVTLELVCPYCKEQSLRARKDASSDVTCRTEGCQDERGEQPRWTRSTWALLLSEAS